MKLDPSRFARFKQQLRQDCASVLMILLASVIVGELVHAGYPERPVEIGVIVVACPLVYYLSRRMYPND